MSIDIHINIPHEFVHNDSSGGYLDRALRTFGFVRAGGAPVVQPATETAASAQPELIITNTPRAGESEEQTRVRRSRGRKADAPQISTGENRVNPEDPPEDQEQDKADEAAESAANKTGLTLDDLRQAVGRYQKKHGMPAAVANIPGILGCAVNDVPDTQEALEQAIFKVDAATAASLQEAPAASNGLFGDEEEQKPPVTATKQDVIKAMMDYALKFDGQNTDQAKMVNTMADVPQIFAKAFGAGCDKLSAIPNEAESYGKAVTAVREAIETNPFKR